MSTGVTASLVHAPPLGTSEPSSSNPVSAADQNSRTLSLEYLIFNVGPTTGGGPSVIWPPANVLGKVLAETPTTSRRTGASPNSSVVVPDALGSASKVSSTTFCDPGANTDPSARAKATPTLPDAA